MFNSHPFYYDWQKKNYSKFMSLVPKMLVQRDGVKGFHKFCMVAGLLVGVLVGVSTSLLQAGVSGGLERRFALSIAFGVSVVGVAIWEKKRGAS